MSILLLFLPLSVITALAAGYLTVFIEGKALQLEKDSIFPSLFRSLLLFPFLEGFVEFLDLYIGRNVNKLTHLKFMLIVVFGILAVTLCLVLPQVVVVVMVLSLVLWVNRRGSI
jgi:hypothetical protein